MAFSFLARVLYIFHIHQGTRPLPLGSNRRYSSKCVIFPNCEASCISVLFPLKIYLSLIRTIVGDMDSFGVAILRCFGEMPLKRGGAEVRPKLARIYLNFGKVRNWGTINSRK